MGDLAPPLLAGADLTHMNSRAVEIYLNREVLAVNQDALGAGAERIASAGPGLEVWAKVLGSRTSGEYAVLLLNSMEQPNRMEVHWTDLDLLPDARVRDLWSHKDVSTASDSYQAVVPAHGAVLLRVSGTRSWEHGVVYEAEWPGIERAGVAALFGCGECSRGYAVGLADKNRPGSLHISNIVVPMAGLYTLRVQYVRNGIADEEIGIDVNGVKTKALALMRSWNWVDVPITLQAGENDITLSYKGEQPFYVDNMTLLRRR